MPPTISKVSAHLGAEIVMLNRPSDRAVTAQQSVQEYTGGDSSRVVSIDCDLMDFDSVRRAAEV